MLDIVLDYKNRFCSTVKVSKMDAPTPTKLGQQKNDVLEDKNLFFSAVKPNYLDGSFYNKGTYHTLPIKFQPIKFIRPDFD